MLLTNLHILKRSPITLATRWRSYSLAAEQLAAKNGLQKSDTTRIILAAKKESKLTFDQLSRRLKLNKVWLVSAILGRHPIEPNIGRRLIQNLSITGSEDEIEKLVDALAEIPSSRGDVQTKTMNDPAIRRLDEMITVYGESIKEIIREEAGDGIMSAIDCTLHVHKKLIKSKDGKNDEIRIILTVDGKYLQYKVDHESNE